MKIKTDEEERDVNCEDNKEKTNINCENDVDVNFLIVLAVVLFIEIIFFMQ